MSSTYRLTGRIEAGDFMVAVDAYLTAHERPQPEQRETRSVAS